MHLSELHLHQFRSHHDVGFRFDSGVTMIVGQNGSGKTNLLEAVYVLASGSSFRDGDMYLAEYETDWWKIEGVVDGQPREVRYQNGVKQLRAGGKVLQRISPQARMPVVLFEPDDLRMIHGSPSGRRKYIDRVIAGTVYGYGATLRKYERILSQRNALLRSGATDHDTLFVLDIMLAEAAEKIVAARRDVIASWNLSLSEIYSHISSHETAVRADYISSVESQAYKQSFITRLKERLERDRLTGSTSVGPHRDDYEFYLNTKPFVTTASRGEVRSLLLALKYIETLVLDEKYATASLLLLDDVFSELDEVRQRLLSEYFCDHQVIITTTHHESAYRTIRLGA